MIFNWFSMCVNVCMYVCITVLQWLSPRRKLGVAENRLRLGLNMKAKVMIFNLFCNGFRRAENWESLKIDLGWASVWGAKVTIFNKFCNGFRRAENWQSLKMGLRWPSVWGAKAMIFTGGHRAPIGL